MGNYANFLERLFKIKERNSSVRTELIAGLTTFVAMAYIIFVNPKILAASGMPVSAAIAATIWSSFIASAVMGLWANYPVAAAPGMGLNAFFTYTVVLSFGLSWQTALGAVFISGAFFLALTLGRVRQAIINSVPKNIKSAFVVGIGSFIAFIGLQNSGLVVADPATLVKAGHIASLNFSELGNKAPLLTCLGVIFTGVMMSLEMRGAILLGIFFTTILGMICEAVPIPYSIKEIISLNPPSLFGEEGAFWEMDLKGALSYGVFNIIFTFTIVELFDNMGTLIGLTRKAGLMKEDGKIENLDRALTSDAAATMVGAVLGTSTVTSYIESAAGVAEGGRTGLTALTVAVLFLAALFFSPLINLVPAFATAPALIIVGALMMSEASHIEFGDITESLPIFLTIIMMPLTYSIANGFAFGFVSYALLKLCSGRAREVSGVMLAVSLAFIVNFYYRLH